MAFYENEIHKLSLRLAAIEGDKELDPKLKPHERIEQHADESLKAKRTPDPALTVEHSGQAAHGPLVGNADVKQEVPDSETTAQTDADGQVENDGNSQKEEEPIN